MAPDRRILELFGIGVPILQAPMAGSSGVALAVAVAEAGGLGALPCAMLGPEQIRSDLALFRQRTDRPVNLNFFCHVPPEPDAARDAAWRARLAPYFAEMGVDPDTIPAGPGRASFDEVRCGIVEELRPEIVSCHFGLPEARLVARVKAAGAKLIASATTVPEALWLEAHGCDAIIAQGAEAGGHRGMFLGRAVETQVGTFALVPQVVDAVRVPVIAAGGIGDARGIVAAFALGAAAVQIGTAYLRCPESLAGPVHREVLAAARDRELVLTNIFTGRPARGFVNRVIRDLGAIRPDVPTFPLATGAMMPLRAKAEAAGSSDFSALWAGQGAALALEMPAGALTRKLASDAAALLERLSALAG